MSAPVAAAAGGAAAGRREAAYASKIKKHFETQSEEAYRISVLLRGVGEVYVFLRAMMLPVGFLLMVLGAYTGLLIGGSEAVFLPTVTAILLPTVSILGLDFLIEKFRKKRQRKKLLEFSPELVSEVREFVEQG